MEDLSYYFHDQFSNHHCQAVSNFQFHLFLNMWYVDANITYDKKTMKRLQVNETLLFWNTQLNNELLTLVAETQIASLAWAASIRVYFSNNDSDSIEKLKYFHVYEHMFDKFLV